MVTKLKEILEPASRVKPFYRWLNLWDVDPDDGVLIGVDGSFTSCYELESLPDIIHKTREEQADFLSMLGRALAVLPDETVLVLRVSGREGADFKKIKDYELSSFKKDEEGELENIISARKKEIIRRKLEQFTFNKNLRNITYSMFITTPPHAALMGATGQNARGVDRFYFNKLLSPPRENLARYHEDKISRHKEIAKNFTDAISSNSIGVRPRRLDRDEILEDIYTRLNPVYSQTVNYKDLDLDEPETLRSQLCRQAVKTEFYYTTLDGQYIRGVNLYRRPETVDFINIAEFLAALDVPYDVVWTVRYTPDSLQSDSVIRKELRFEMTLASSTMTAEGRQKAEAIGRMLDETREAQERIFDFSMCVVTSDRNKDALISSRTTSVLGAFKKISDAEGLVEDMNHMYLFLSTLPGHWFYNTRRSHKFPLSSLTHLLPFNRAWQGTKRAAMIFPTAGAEVIGLDLFDSGLPAKHGLIIGSTGSGKSFTTNYILTNFLVESIKNHVVIIDVGGSYRKLCELFNGQYIDIKYGDDKCAFNPFPAPEFFWMKDGKEEDAKPDADTLSFLSLVVQKMLKINVLSGNDTMIIERALINSYKRKKESGETSPPMLGDFAYELKEYQDGDQEDKARARSFWKDLGPWVEGRYSVLLNNPRSNLVIDPRKQMIVFDLEKIKNEPDLGPVMFFVVRSAIQSRLSDLSLKKIIVIDEGWQFFSDNVGTQLIENLYRTARKFGGAVFSISQSPEDFLNTPVANAIITNTYTKFILKLTAHQELLRKLGLTGPEVEEVKNLQMSPGKYSEVFYKFYDKGCIVLRVQPNKLDYWISTTNDRDRQEEERMKREHPGEDLWKIIQKLADKKDDRVTGEGK